MEQLPTINLRRGATAVLQVDLTNFDMQGGFAVLTIADRNGTPLKSWTMDEARIWHLTVPDEFTSTLKVSDSKYFYDIMWHLNDERFAQCEPSPVTVEFTAGGYQHGGK